jgi:hypothetical protein
MAKCIICNQRPANGNLEGFCGPCFNKVQAERRARRKEKPFRYVTYRGDVVGMFPVGGGVLRARLLGVSPDRLPKSITLDLNTYLEGFEREQIKRLKACVLQLAHA